jgi:hypothetical protein
VTIGGAGGGEHDIVVLREARDRPARVFLADGAWGEDAAVGDGADGGAGEARRRLLLNIGGCGSGRTCNR